MGIFFLKKKKKKRGEPTLSKYCTSGIETSE
jgi:hypothetical protein